MSVKSCIWCTKYDKCVNINPSSSFDLFQAEKCELFSPVKDLREAKKADANKDRWDLFHWLAAEQVVKVGTYGSLKYGDNNWKEGEGLSEERLLAALMRHLLAWRRKEKVDPESNLPHLAHAAWNLLAILELDLGSEKFPLKEIRWTDQSTFTPED